MLRPLSPEHGDDETFEGLLILRPEGRLFFVNAQEVGQQIQALVAKYQPRVLVLDMSRVSDIEYSALQMLIEGERRMTEGGVEVWLAGVESRRAGDGAKHRPRQAAWSRAHAVQRARGDRALPEKCPSRRVAGQRGRSREFRTRLSQTTGPEQKVAPRRRQGRVVAQGVGVGDLVYQPEARVGPERHAVGDRAIEIDHGRALPRSMTGRASWHPRARTGPDGAFIPTEQDRAPARGIHWPISRRESTTPRQRNCTASSLEHRGASGW